MLTRKPSIFSNCVRSNSHEMQVACAELEAICPDWIKLPMLFEHIYCTVASVTHNQMLLNEYRWITIRKVKIIIQRMKQTTP